jgi:addiction module HigA family antidote
MASQVETNTVGKVLQEEYMEPNGISAERLAQDLEFPLFIIRDVLQGKRRITADLSVRLGEYFGISEMYYMNLEMEAENQRNMDEAIALLKGSAEKKSE